MLAAPENRAELGNKREKDKTMANKTSRKAANSSKPAKAAGKASKPISKAAKAAGSERVLNMTNSNSGTPGTLQGYRGHRPGSRKESIHILFDKCKDREKIMQAIEKAKLSPATANTWIAAWGGMKSAGQGAPKSAKAKAA
jgi:hypothetical protein